MFKMRVKTFLEKKGKKSLSELTLDERLELLGQLEFTYDMGLYDIIDDFLLKKHLPELDSRFGGSHRTYQEAGGGMTGSEITEVGIGLPRTGGNRLYRFFSPTKPVIKVNFRRWGASVKYDRRYEESARKIKEDYDGLLKGKLGYEMNVQLMG